MDDDCYVAATPRQRFSYKKFPVHPMISNEGYTRRIDVGLRARFPNLQTRIFEISSDRYVIVFDKNLMEAEEIRDHFNNKIKQVTVVVDISNDLPSTYLREIPPIRDQDLSCGYEGLPLRKFDLFNILASRFPDLPILDIEDTHDPTTVINIKLGHEIGADLMDEVESFCRAFKLPAEIEIKVVPDGIFDPKWVSDIPPVEIRSSKLRPDCPSFVKSDEAFWFSNIDFIYAGGMPPERFPGMEPSETSCYLDLSAGDNLNLRQALLLYDVVYCSPPTADQHETFLAKQGFRESDLLYLVEQNRLRFLLTDPEEILNTAFLENVAERSPSALMGRRTVAALLASDLVQTAREYRLADPAASAAVGELSKELGSAFGIPPDTVLQMLLWPVAARRQSLTYLLDRGSKGVLGFGVGEFVAPHFSKIRLEALTRSERVHVGHALRATVFPARGEPEGYSSIMNIMGDSLNFYRSFNTRIAAAWAGNEERRMRGISIMPPLPLFEFDGDVPIAEFHDATSLGSTRAKGRALFSRLAELPVELRQEEIDHLSAELRKKKAREGGHLISFETLEDVGPAVELIADVTLPPFFAVKNVARRIREACRRNRNVDGLVQHVEADLFKSVGRNQDLDFLSRIDRVATFKKTRLS
jgi:hypothetical protein